MSQSTFILKMSPELVAGILTSLYESMPAHARVLIKSPLGDETVIVESPVTVLPDAEAKPAWLLLSKIA